MTRLLAGLLLLALSPPLHAEPLNCGKPKDVFADVAKRYGETPSFAMVRDNGQVLLFTVNPDTASWTMWAQQGDDKICPVMGGDSFDVMTQPKPGRDA